MYLLIAGNRLATRQTWAIPSGNFPAVPSSRYFIVCTILYLVNVILMSLQGFAALVQTKLRRQ